MTQDKKKCLLAIYDKEKKFIYDCDEVRRLEKTWKENFRRVNAVEEDTRDIYYESYCEQIDDFLRQCKCQK